MEPAFDEECRNGISNKGQSCRNRAAWHRLDDGSMCRFRTILIVSARPTARELKWWNFPPTRLSFAVISLNRWSNLSRRNQIHAFFAEGEFRNFLEYLCLFPGLRITRQRMDRHRAYVVTNRAFEKIFLAAESRHQSTRTTKFEPKHAKIKNQSVHLFDLWFRKTNPIRWNDRIWIHSVGGLKRGHVCWDKHVLCSRKMRAQRNSRLAQLASDR